MGCDIHMYIEKRVEGRWRWVSNWADFLDARNYRLFGILAGVRTRPPAVVQIAEPRGLPEDLSDGLRDMHEKDDMDGPVRKRLGAFDNVEGPDARTEIHDAEFTSYYLGDHSYTWLTLDEVLAYDWDGNPVHEQGAIGLAGYFEWKRSGERYPGAWSAAVVGGTCRTYREQEVLTVLSRLLPEHEDPKVAEAALLRQFDEQGISPYIHAYWTVSAREACSYFIDTWVPFVRTLADDPKDIRLVFGFDS